MVAIGCAATALLVGLAVVVLMLEARNLVVWSLKSVRTEVEQSLPEDLPSADRQRLERAFAGALRRLREGDLDPQAFQQLQRALLEFARRADAPARDDVRSLIEALEHFAEGTPSGQEPDTGEPTGGTEHLPAEA